MKIIYLIFTLTIAINSCGFNVEQDEYSFDNFKETPLWDLAQAVRNDDADKIKSILKLKRININFQDPKYKQTLLSLAIENGKRQAFLELLNHGANSNQLLGRDNDGSPLLYAVRDDFNCDLFFVKNLLDYGANPNMEIKNPNPEMFFSDSFPLLCAVRNNNDDGKDCLEMVKLLVERGANINCCYKQSFSTICEGVISECISSKSMETLKYFIIEKKIVIPNAVYEEGGLGEEPSVVYTLSEILNTDKFNFEKSLDLKKAKDDILKYLEK